MKKMSIRTIGNFIFFLFFLQCSQTENVVIKHQVTGPIDCNCYLVYGTKTKEAALIDVAGPIDTLLTHMKEHELDLKYFFFTHGHFDHLMGLPAIRNQFPEAKVCIHKEDYQDMLVAKDWILNNIDQEFIDYVKNDPKLCPLLEFDATTFGHPDIFIEDNQIFKLGYLEIRAIHSPGHSPGCVCFHVNNSLFSGDVLFYRSVGTTDIMNSSRNDQINSVQRLYALFPDETIVYPGHRQFTDIGSEKRENKRIRVDGGEWVTQ
jgi:glyoxylase-like metal-dependent hydrolase (beta-lactamase superfamily II)